MKGKKEIVSYLFEKCKTSVETKDNNERTAIHLASQNGKLNIVQYLFETCHANV